jgi:hypothetical protein
MKKIKKTKTINVGDDDAGAIKITSFAGNGNFVGNNVAVDDEVVKKGTLTNYKLGSAEELKGKTFTITSNGFHMNANRPEVPVTHEFTGAGLDGNESFVYPEDDDTDAVPDPADGLISYIIKYKFK